MIPESQGGLELTPKMKLYESDRYSSLIFTDKGDNCLHS